MGAAFEAPPLGTLLANPALAINHWLLTSKSEQVLFDFGRDINFHRILLPIRNRIDL